MANLRTKALSLYRKLITEMQISITDLQKPKPVLYCCSSPLNNECVLVDNNSNACLFFFQRVWLRGWCMQLQQKCQNWAVHLIRCQLGALTPAMRTPSALLCTHIVPMFFRECGASVASGTMFPKPKGMIWGRNTILNET